MRDSETLPGKGKDESATILFTETQRCTWWPLWVILIGVDLLAVANFVVWLIRGTGLGNVPPNTATWILSFICIGLVTIPFMMLKLSTHISSSAIHVRLSPPPLGMMHQNCFPRHSVKRVYIREYHEFREYGGFGFRVGNPSVGDAISMNGNKGLQLELVNGQKVLIGTRKPEELKAVITRLKSST
ncbi:MAG: hypothetical protein LBI64_08715 [Coriobacteriales bacterium]|nr:hypothetical protein [Coriobacteriales bacterium]